MSLPDYCPFAPDLPECQAPDPEPEPTDPEPESEEETTDPTEEETTDPTEEETEEKSEETDEKEMEKGGDKHEHMGEDHGDKDGWGMSSDDWGKDPLLDLMKLETILKWSMRDPVMSNIAYLVIILMTTVQTALQLFRYQYSGYLDAYKVSGYNGFEIGQYVFDYSVVVIGSILTITQLLSMLNIAVSINLMAWTYGMLALSIFAIVKDILLWWGYEKHYSDTKTESSVYKMAMLQHTLMTTVVGFALYQESEGWLAGQFEMLPEEEQEKWVIDVITAVAEEEAKKLEEEGMTEEEIKEAFEGDRPEDMQMDDAAEEEAAEDDAAMDEAAEEDAAADEGDE